MSTATASAKRTHLRPGEIARLIGSSPWKVYRLVYNGALDSVKIGRDVFIPVKSFEAVFQTKYEQ
jgi:hypothetical protein